MPRLFGKKSEEGASNVELPGATTRRERASSSSEEMDEFSSAIGKQESETELLEATTLSAKVNGSDSVEELLSTIGERDSVGFTATSRAEMCKEFNELLTKWEKMEYGPVVEVREYLKGFRKRARKDVNFFDGTPDEISDLIVRIKDECNFFLWCYNLRAALESTDDQVERKYIEKILSVSRALKDTSDIPITQLNNILQLVHRAIFRPDRDHITACQEESQRLPRHQIESNDLFASLLGRVLKTPRVVQRDPLKQAVEELAEHLSRVSPSP